MIRTAALSLTILFAGCVQAPETPAAGIETAPEEAATALEKDIDILCQGVRDTYAYFDERADHWPRACERALLEARDRPNGLSGLDVLERLVDDLYDPHMNLSVNDDTSPRLVPSGADLWFEARSGLFEVVGVRPGSSAAAKDVRIGDVLVSFNGLDQDALIMTRIHSGRADITEERRTWALNAAIAGHRGKPRRLSVLRGGEERSFTLGTPYEPQSRSPITSYALRDRFGYIRVNNSLGNSQTVAAFDAAIATLSKTEGLILDLRDTPGGGNTGVAEPILGRFISAPGVYQLTVLSDGSIDPRQVEPRPLPPYEAPVIVLSGRWTGSMGEGMTIGLDGLRRAEVLGAPMAGLAGGTTPLALPNLGISLWLPTYDLRHVDGTPRHLWEPDPANLQIADWGDRQDRLMDEALARLTARVTERD